LTQAWFMSAQTQPEPHMPAGWRVMKFDSLDSTNAALRRIVELEGDVAEGLMIWAKTQTAGRGRMGRAWESPEGNVYASILVKTPEDQATAPQIGFVTAVAVADAILDLPRHNAPPPPVSHKWPNDVLANGKKVCGILPEMVTDLEEGSWIIVGVGINLIPVDVERAAYPVGSLAAHNIDTTPEHVLTVFCRAFTTRLAEWRRDGFATLREVWLEKAPDIGAQISVGVQGGAVQGNFAGLDADGALLLDSPLGRQRLLAGDVLFAGGDA
jgi:BirA family transcriptional regulator, biotin operon repressor / biotin---[acetyl-CoA-carboxylase] ligase